MARFVKGDVVVVPFPFSDLTGNKRRPAVVVAALTGDDVILCQVTSQSTSDSYSISLTTPDMTTGSLKQDSNIRPNRLFTADSHLILYHVGQLTPAKLTEVVEAAVKIIRA